MRDILFRGKTVGANGKFVYGNLIHVGDYCCILEREEDIHEMDTPYLDGEIGWIDGKATPVIPETVGQYVGLKDSEGNKIFEGDILESPAKRYDERHGSMIVIKDIRECRFAALYAADYHVCCNIHDNPEFLEAIHQ